MFLPHHTCVLVVTQLQSGAASPRMPIVCWTSTVIAQSEMIIHDLAVDWLALSRQIKLRSVSQKRLVYQTASVAKMIKSLKCFGIVIRAVEQP